MPHVEVVLYLEDDRSVPLEDWLAEIPHQARDACLARLTLLEEHGHDLRRPVAEYIEGTDLYELRIKVRKVNYRILNFFHERTAAVVSHGFSKERELPQREIDLATKRMRKFKADPERHTFRGVDDPNA